jgi:alpha-glucosidase
LYQTLARLRRTAPALVHGGVQTLHANDETLAYLREAPEQRIIVVARRADDGLARLPVRHGGIADGARFHEQFSGATSRVTNGALPLADIPAVGAQIWIEQAGDRAGDKH